MFSRVKKLERSIFLPEKYDYQNNVSENICIVYFIKNDVFFKQKKRHFFSFRKMTQTYLNIFKKNKFNQMQIP